MNDLCIMFICFLYMKMNENCYEVIRINSGNLREFTFAFAILLCTLVSP